MGEEEEERGGGGEGWEEDKYKLGKGYVRKPMKKRRKRSKINIVKLYLISALKLLGPLCNSDSNEMIPETYQDCCVGRFVKQFFFNISSS